MQHHAQRPAGDRLAKRVEGVADAVAGVHDQRQPQALCQPDVAVEELPLQVSRSEVAIPVEAGLADRRHPSGYDEPRDTIPFVGLDPGDVVGMNAGGCREA